MKFLLPLSLLLVFGAFAQDEPVNDMYWNSYSYFNPAMSGVNHKIEGNVMYRTQWDEEPGASTTLFSNYGMNIGEKHGLGLNYVRESFNYIERNRLKLNYNYQFGLKEGRKLAVGSAIGFYQSEWSPPWKCMFCLPFYTTNKVVQLDLGAAYYGKNIIAGIGVTQIPIYKNVEHLDNSLHLTGNLRYEGSVFSVPTFIFETRFQTDFVRYRQDFNVGYKIKQFLEVGVGYRTSDAALVNLTGIINERYRIGYSYAMPIDELNTQSRGTHEIVIGLRLPN